MLGHCFTERYALPVALSLKSFFGLKLGLKVWPNSKVRTFEGVLFQPTDSISSF